MKHTIKQEVTVRIALIFIVVIISGIVTVSGMSRIRGYSKSTEQSTEIHSLVLTAQKAHYGWVENLCSAVSMGTEFTGSKDYRTCVLGNWFYSSDLSGVDSRILELIEEMKPIHQAIHDSAQTVLDLSVTDPAQARDMYQNTVKANVSQLVEILDEVAAITEEQVSNKPERSAQIHQCDGDSEYRGSAADPVHERTSGRAGSQTDPCSDQGYYGIQPGTCTGETGFPD